MLADVTAKRVQRSARGAGCPGRPDDDRRAHPDYAVPVLEHGRLATVELFTAAPDDSIWAICSRGRLLRADAGEWTWRAALPDGSALEVKSVAFVAHGWS